MITFFQAYKDENVIAAINKADCNDAAELVPYLKGVLDTPGRFRKTPRSGTQPTAAPAKNRPLVTPELMGISEKAAQAIYDKSRSLKLDLKLPKS